MAVPAPLDDQDAVAVLHKDARQPRERELFTLATGARSVVIDDRREGSISIRRVEVRLDAQLAAVVEHFRVRRGGRLKRSDRREGGGNNCTRQAFGKQALPQNVTLNPTCRARGG